MPELLKPTELVPAGPERLFQTWHPEIEILELPITVPSFDAIAIRHPRSQNDGAHRSLRDLLSSLV